MFSPAFWWVIVGIGLMLCEFVMPGLILFFFGIGALITALFAWVLPISLTAQLVIFAIASLATLFGLRRLLKPIFMGSESDVSEGSLSEGMIGLEAKVCHVITPDAPGKVMLNGTPWKAVSEEQLELDEFVVVVGQKSLTLSVKRK